MSGVMLHIGATKEAIQAARNAIIDIIKAQGADAVKIAAFDALKTICEVKDTKIENCTFNGEKK